MREKNKFHRQAITDPDFDEPVGSTGGEGGGAQSDNTVTVTLGGPSTNWESNPTDDRLVQCSSVHLLRSSGASHGK